MVIAIVSNLIFSQTLFWLASIHLSISMNNITAKTKMFYRPICFKQPMNVANRIPKL